MPAINPLPQAIVATNPPAFGPTGQDYELARVTAQDLADGVCIIVDNHQGGTQTVRAVIDHHYHENDEQFLAISEIDGYERLQVDVRGNDICRRPVYTVRHDEIIDAIACELLAEAFARRMINIEYPIARKVQSTYATEIRLLCEGVITSGADNFTIAIDNADSAAKRKRHGYDSEMIRSMTDLIARQSPVSGFIYSSTGPGNVIIEALRRCDVPIGKRIKAAEAVRGFAGMTTRDVMTYWDRAYSHRTVAPEHAWKYDRNRPVAPALLDMPVRSAILMAGTPASACKEHPVVKGIRKEIARRQAEAARKRNAETGKGRMTARQPSKATPAKTPAPFQQDFARRRERVKFEGGGLIARLRSDGVKCGDVITSAVTALIENDVPFPGLPATRDIDSVAAFASRRDVIALALKASGTADRTNVNSRGAFACAHALCEAADPERARAFFRSLSRRPVGSDPGATLIRRLHGLTRAERTPHRVLDYILQAWDAYVAGRQVEQFVDRHDLGRGANDNDVARRRAA